jgi:hypothetical protein
METEIVWPHDREYPNPTLYPDLFLRCYDDETKREARFRTPASPIESVRKFSTFFEKWRNFYDVKKFNEEQLKKVAGIMYAQDSVIQSYGVEFLKNKNVTPDVFFQKWKNHYNKITYVDPLPEGIGIVKYCLQKGCTVAHYFNGFVDFYIFRDKQRSLNGPMYTLVLKFPYDGRSYHCSSDIPTVGFGRARDYRSDNEILSLSFRERILSTLAYEEFFWGRCFMYRGGCKFNADVYAENCASVLKFDYLVEQDSNGKAIRAWKKQKSGDAERFKPLDLKCLPGDIKCGR